MATSSRAYLKIVRYEKAKRLIDISSPEFSSLKATLQFIAEDCQLNGFAIFRFRSRPALDAETAPLVETWQRAGFRTDLLNDTVFRLALGVQMRRAAEKSGFRLIGPSIHRLGGEIGLAYVLSTIDGAIHGIALSLGDNPSGLGDCIEQCDRALTSLASQPLPTIRLLSHRELEVAKWLAEGKTSFEVSVILGLSEHTVNEYIRVAMKKLGSTNRLHFVANSIRLGLVS